MRPVKPMDTRLRWGYLTMLNDHDPDGVDGFVAVDPDHFVADGPEFNRALWSTFFTAFPDTGRLAADIVRDAELNVYPGAPHGLPATFTDTFDDDLVAVARR
jgi:hypothetical protein